MLPYYGPPFRYDEIEEKKHERELQYRLELQKLESERRREKREHEVQLLQIMMAMKGSSSAPVPAAHQYQPNTSYAPFSGDATHMVGYSSYPRSTSSSYTSDEGNTYYKL